MWQMHVQFLILKCEVQDNFDWILIFLLEDVEYDHLSNASVIAMFVSSLWQDVYCPFEICSSGPLEFTPNLTASASCHLLKH